MIKRGEGVLLHFLFDIISELKYSLSSYLLGLKFQVKHCCLDACFRSEDSSPLTKDHQFLFDNFPPQLLIPENH